VLYQLSYSGLRQWYETGASGGSFGYNIDNVEHPVSIGDRSLLAAMLALQAAGLPFLTPFGENTRYDLVLDLGTRFARVQCKTGRLRGGAVRFAACSTYAHHPNPRIRRRDYGGEIDYFAVYCPETAGVYLIPLDEFTNRVAGSLRVEPSRNGQQRGIRYADDYRIGDICVTVASAR
jgi:hypothetical protein